MAPSTELAAVGVKLVAAALALVSCWGIPEEKLGTFLLLLATVLPVTQDLEQVSFGYIFRNYSTSFVIQ